MYHLSIKLCRKRVVYLKPQAGDQPVTKGKGVDGEAASRVPEGPHGPFRAVNCVNCVVNCVNCVINCVSFCVGNVL